MKRLFALALLLLAPLARGAASSPLGIALALEARMAAGDGVTLPDPATELVRHAGTVDLSEGDWPAAFHARAGETICVAVSPFTGDYEFFDESGECFFTLVPVLPTTENWVAPFRHAEEGTHPDDDLYAPWRLVDVWILTHAEFAESAEFSGRARSPSAPPFVARHSSLVTRGASSPATNLCFTSFSFTETNLYFSAAWPTNEPLPDSVLDLYGSTNLLDPRWLFLSSHPATTNPVAFAVERASLPWYVEPTQHVHDATCVSVTNVVLSPLDGVSVYTNTFWSCETNRTPGEVGFFRLGTHRDTDGDGLFDAYELLVLGTDPANPDTDLDGVPDGLTAAQWLSHPLWAHNGDGTNLVILLYEPITNGVAALRFDDLCIPLSSNAGPWCLCLPTNAVVRCSLVAEPGVLVELWYGPPEAAVPTRSFVPEWFVPYDVAEPIWCDRPSDVFGGNDRGGGSCRFARPTLRVRSDEPGQEDSADVCVHGSDGLVRFSWSVEPAACTGLWAYATGDLEPLYETDSFYLDVNDAVPGELGARTGSLFAFSEQSPFFGDDVLFGALSATLSAHRCLGLLDNTYGYCLSCGVVHGDRTGSSACYHAPWCATKTDLDEDCDCAAPFVRVGNVSGLRLVGDPELAYCCHAHYDFPYGADLLSAPAGLGAAISNGVFLSVAPAARSPTIGGFVARYRVCDPGWNRYRDLSLPFTCADLGVDPCLSNAQVPYGEDPEAYFVTNGVFYVARRSSPYPLRLWNESPSDARLVLSFESPTNGPVLRANTTGDPSLVGALSVTNATPFAALNDDRTVYLDASCSNALATLSLDLSDPATDRTFLSESLSVQVVDTTIGEHWRVRSATDSISWDFSDAPEPVWICLRHPAQNGEYLGQMVGSPVVSKTPSFSLDLPPNDYLIEAYFPRIYDGHSYVICETNTLHIASISMIAESTVALVGGEVRTRFRLSDDSSPTANWRISPVLDNGARLFSSSEGGTVGASQVFHSSSVWVSPGSVATNYVIYANDPRIGAASGESALSVLPLQLVPDYGLDLTIGGDDALDAITGRVFRIWVNDDVDAASSPLVYQTDIPQLAGATSSSAPDCYDDRVGGYFDLIDFFPVWMNCHSALMVFPPTSGFSWNLRQTTPSIKLVWTSLQKSEAGCYQTDPISCTGDQFSYPVWTSSVSELVGGSISIPSPVLMLCQTNPESGVFLIEGLTSSSTDLELTVEKNGKVFGRAILSLSVSPVDEMYRTINLRPFLGGATSPQTRLSTPPNLPDTECSAATVVFVHGFNVDHDEARGWFSEAFKRLRWSGVKAKFVGVTWEGDVGWPNGLHYHEDVNNAFLSAQQLASSLEPFSTNLSIVAHSLGNMVVSSSICDFGLRPSQYFLLNAAIPEEAFDDSRWNDSTNGNPMVHHEWKDYLQRTWSANWHKLFLDDRRKLTWKNRFSSLCELPGIDIYNYYSSGDEVIGLYTLVSSDGMVHVDGLTGYEMRNHSWQKQERFKGRAGFDVPSGAAGTDEAGWGFRQFTRWVEPPSGNFGYFEQYPIPSSIANTISTNDLPTNTVFRPEPQSLFSPVQTNTEINTRLAKAIPALSGGVGASPLLSIFGQSHSYDMQQPGNPTAFPNGRITHSPYGTAFRHSDVKGLSYYHCFNIWRQLASDLAEGLEE